MGLDAEHAIQARFAEMGFTSGGEFYVPSSAVLHYLDECRSAELGVAGVEGFELLGDKVRPRMGLIADFSTLFEVAHDWIDTVERSHQEARSFFARQAPDGQVWWDFTLLGEP